MYPNRHSAVPPFRHSIIPAFALRASRQCGRPTSDRSYIIDRNYIEMPYTEKPAKNITKTRRVPLLPRVLFTQPRSQGLFIREKSLRTRLLFTGNVDSYCGPKQQSH